MLRGPNLDELAKSYPSGFGNRFLIIVLAFCLVMKLPGEVVRLEPGWLGTVLGIDFYITTGWLIVMLWRERKRDLSQWVLTQFTRTWGRFAQLPRKERASIGRWAIHVFGGSGLIFISSFLLLGCYWPADSGQAPSEPWRFVIWLICHAGFWLVMTAPD
jgi:hypothetical protein